MVNRSQMTYLVKKFESQFFEDFTDEYDSDTLLVDKQAVKDLIFEIFGSYIDVDNVDVSKKGQKRELADIGNIAMMLHDNS